MAEIERDIIGRTNKQGYLGFPTLYNFPMQVLEGVPPESLVVTDLIGSSLSWFSKQKPLSVP